MIAKSGKTEKSDVTLSNGEALFKELASFYASTYINVERAMIFGFDCLRTKGKVFAKVHNGQLVMKLPTNRITALLGSGQADTYELRGRMLKEWAVIEASKDIVVLAEEARVFTEA